MNIINTIQNLIKRGVISRKTDDTGQFPVSQVSFFGEAANAQVLNPYGIYNNLPIGAACIILNIMGQESNKFVIGNVQKERFKNLKEGEVAVGNPLTLSVIKFLENGDIEITGVADQNINITGSVNLTVGGDLTANVTGNTSLTSPVTTITGALNVTGDITAFSTGASIPMSDIKATFNIHTHNENDNAPAPTNAPNSSI